MDVVPIRMLEELPPPLKIRGWRFVPKDSRSYGALATIWYIAVYVRPYEAGVDDERFARPSRDECIRVSTHSSRSPSWVDAYHDAVQMMQEIDNRRKPGDR